jgi:hypothetical protein
MANKSRGVERPTDGVQSRRNFLKWVKQAAAGASLAAIGLGLMDPSEVLAASRNAPNGTPCYGCIIIEHGGLVPQGCGCGSIEEYQNRIETAGGIYPNCTWSYPYCGLALRVIRAVAASIDVIGIGQAGKSFPACPMPVSNKTNPKLSRHAHRCPRHEYGGPRRFR